MSVCALIEPSGKPVHIDEGLAQYFEKKGLIEETSTDDDGNLSHLEKVSFDRFFTLAYDINLWDFEYAKKIWQDRDTERRKKRIEDLLSEEETDQGAASDQIVPLTFIKKLRRDAVNMDAWSERYRDGYIDALDDLMDRCSRG